MVKDVFNMHLKICLKINGYGKDKNLMQTLGAEFADKCVHFDELSDRCDKAIKVAHCFWDLLKSKNIIIPPVGPPKFD